MKQNKKIFLPWYKKKNRGRDKWNRFESRKKKMHTYKRTKAKYPCSGDKRKRK